MDKAWIALHVRTGTEADVLRALEAKEGAEALAPMEQILRRKDGCARRIIRPLLPGYVLVCWERSGNLWHRIRRITGVIRILGGYPPGRDPGKTRSPLCGRWMAYCRRVPPPRPAARMDAPASREGRSRPMAADRFRQRAAGRARLAEVCWTSSAS